MAGYPTPVRLSRPSWRLSTPWLVIPSVFAASAICWLVCQRRDNEQGATDTLRQPSVATSSAMELLHRMEVNYRNLESYSDRTRLRASYRTRGVSFEDRAELDVTWRRPSSVAIRIAHGPRRMHMTADGQRLRARLEDPQFPQLSEQMVSRPVTTSLSILDVQSAFDLVDSQQPNARTNAMASLPGPLTASPLAVLLGARVAEEIQSGSSDISLLPATTFRGSPVARVQLQSEYGPFVLWMDPATAYLRRVEFPPPPPRPDVDGWSITAEFTDIAANRRVPDESFQFSVSATTKVVQYFVLPPNADVPSQLGSRVASLHFTDLHGQTANLDNRQARVTILVWFSNHESSRGVLQEVTESRAALANVEACEFLAICTEPSTEMSHQDVADLVHHWNVSMRTVRDLDAVGRDMLGIEQAPTIAILDRKQRVQFLQVGGDSHLDQLLTQMIQRLSTGEEIATEYRDANRQVWEKYRETVRAAAVLDD